MDPQTMENHIANFRYFQEQFNNLRTYDMQVREAIAELKDRSQTGTLQEYLEPFQSLLNDGWVEEELAINLFLGGLRAKIRNSLSFFQPSTLHNAYLLAKLQEFIHGHDDFGKDAVDQIEDRYKQEESDCDYHGENASDQIEVGQEQEESDCNYQSENIPHQIKIEQEHNIPHHIKIEQEQVESDFQYHSDVGNFEAASPGNHVREVSGKEPKELRISNSSIQANPKLWPFEVVVDHDDKYVEDGESDREKEMVACGSQKEHESDSFDKEYGDMSQLGQLLSISLMRTGVLQTNSWFSIDGDLAPMLMLARVQRKHSHLLVINVAHETIACGKRGGCVAEAFIYREDIIVCVGTRSTVIGNRGGLTACSPRRKPPMLSRGHVTMFSTISPILYVVVAHATVTVARKEAWCRRKKRAKELHARRFLAVTFEFASVMARRLKPSWEFGFLAIDAAKRVLTQEAIYYDLLDSSIEASLVGWFLLYAPHYIQHKYTEVCDQLMKSGNFNVHQLLVVAVETLFYGYVVRKGRTKIGCTLLQRNKFFITREYDSHALFKVTIESDLAEQQLKFFVVNSQLTPPIPLEEPVRCLSSAKQGEDLFIINKFLSNKEIFLSLHELISNASDAFHKIHFENLTGMTEAELVSNLCTKGVFCDPGSSRNIQFQVKLGRLDFYVKDFSLGRYRGFRFKSWHYWKKTLFDMLGPQWFHEELEHFYETYFKQGKDWTRMDVVLCNRSVEMLEDIMGKQFECNSIDTILHKPYVFAGLIDRNRFIKSDSRTPQFDWISLVTKAWNSRCNYIAHDSEGNLVANNSLTPLDIKALASHGRKMKLGHLILHCCTNVFMALQIFQMDSDSTLLNLEDKVVFKGGALL